jgi:hypothetical protein
VSINGGWIYDYAYETSPDTPIEAGQIGAPVFFSANLTGTNEVPPNHSANSGKAVFTLESFVDDFILTYHLELNGTFEPTNAAIYGPANPNRTSPIMIANLGGGVISNLPPPANIPTGPVPFTTDLMRRPQTISQPPSVVVYDGQITLSSNQVAQLLRGQLYVNLKSTRYRQGELRGEIWPTTPVQYSATLSGVSGLPRGRTIHHGEAQFILSGPTLSYELAVDTNFAGAIVAIFPGRCPPQETRANIIWLAATIGIQVPAGGIPDEPGSPGQILYSGQNTLTDAQVSQFYNGQLYIEALARDYRNGVMAGRIIVP